MSGLADLQMIGADAPPPRRHRRRRRLPKAVGVLVVLVVVLAFAGGAVLGGRAVLDSFRGAGSGDFSGQGSGDVVVQVSPGDSASDIGTTLQAKGVVKTVGAFRKAAAADQRSLTIQPGFYQLRKQMSATAAVALLLDPASRSRSRVTLPEGVTVAQAIAKINESTGISLADLQAAVADPSRLGLPDYAGGQLEGFLFPATYDVEPGTSAADALKAMVTRFGQAATELDLQGGAARLGLTPYQVLITASFIERETAFPDDRARVARAVYNRYAQDKAFELDSTINYLREEKKARLSIDDLKVESDYNTYEHKGFTPTPIDSPGEEALNAALHPAEGSYIYFVTTSKDGSALFTADYDEFLAAKAKAKADGVY